MTTDTIDETTSSGTVLSDGTVLSPEESGDFKQRWADIQVHFVDDPAASVRDADALVDEVIDRVEERLRDKRETLSGDWDENAETTTEDLRVLTRAYRELIGRLLEIRV